MAKRPNTEQMFEWAQNPGRWQYEGYASSEEEAADLRVESIDGRLDFLYKAAKHEMARRALSAAQTPETKPSEVEARFDFASIPVRRTISLRDCETLAAIYQYHSVMDGERPSWDAGVAKRRWKGAASAYGYMNGYGIDSPKFSDKLFKPSNPRYQGSESDLEQIAEEAYERILYYTKDYSRSGYSLRFLMDGVQRADEACLDVESLELMLKKQRRRSPTERYFAYESIGFWEELVRAKREFDKKGPYKDKRSYADVVDELAPGVYTAPYMDPALVKSRQFISIDDWQRASLAVDTDINTVARLTRGFGVAVALTATGGRYGKRRNYFSEQDPLNSHGATFFDRSLLPGALQNLKYEKAGKFIMPMLEFLIDEGKDAQAVELDPDNLNIVFGTRTVSDEVADILRSV